MASRRGSAAGRVLRGMGMGRRDRKVLTAAAMHVDLTDRAEARKLRRLRMGWQSQAWDFRDQIGELRYAVNFMANCAARMKLYVGAYSADGETDSPVPLADAGGFGQATMDMANGSLFALGNGRAAISGMLHQLSENATIAGEAWFLGMEDPTTGEDRYTVRSVDEIVITDSEYKLREIPADHTGDLGWVTLDPDATYLERMWLEHPRYRLWADSPLRAILDDCESLLILRRGIRAAGRSRLAGAGFLLVPDGLELKRPNDDNSDPEADEFMGTLGKAMMEPIADEGVASAVVPIAIRGAAEALKEFRLLLPGRDFDKLSIDIRQELIGVIATGLDLPREVLEGIGDLNHWSAWQVDDNTFRHHIEPHVIQICHLLTEAFLRPYLVSAGVDPAIANRMLYWYDPTELVTHPDQTKDALELHDRLTISNEALLRVAGFSEQDQPDQAEFLVRLLHNMRQWPPNMVMAAVHSLDPNLVIPPIETAGTVPGVNAQGVDPGTPVALPPGQPAQAAPPAVSGVPPAAPTVPAGGTAEAPGPPSMAASSPPPPPGLRASDDGARACGVCRMFDAGECWGYGNVEVQDAWVCDSFEQDSATAGVVQEADDQAPLVAAGVPTAAAARLSRRLVAIDQDLRARLQVAANAVMLRQLERAGAKVRAHVSRSNETMRMAIAHTRNEHVAGVLGRDALQAANFDTGSLSMSDWSALKPQFMEWTDAAAQAAIATACRLGHLDSDSDAARAAAAAMAEGREAAWTVLEGALANLGHTLLYNPDPAAVVKGLDELNPNTLVPAGTIRAAIGVAGGQPVGDLGVDAIGNPTIRLGAIVGQIGTGATVTDLLTSTGAQRDSYTWIHGPALHPFEPHLDLDGVEFQTFDDQALANPGDWPANQFFMPGDHGGCQCDFQPNWISP